MLKDIARQIAEDIASKADNLERLNPTNSPQFQTLVQNALRKCDLVSREEFDAQAAVLERTRQKLEQLEAAMADIENRINEQ